MEERKKLPTVSEIDLMGREELLALNCLVKNSIVSLKGQIRDAKAVQIATGKYADPYWWASANKALALHQRCDQYVQLKLGSTKRKTLPQYFMEVIQEVLPPREFLRLRQEAEMRMFEDQDR